MGEPRKHPTPTLARVAFKTSRLAEFGGFKLAAQRYRVTGEPLARHART
jgi:hypothetical protein